MKNAYLYIRVSTDEQAIKGFSQRSQADRLEKYCNLNGIKIQEKIFEDYSAKTFNRPEWQKLFTSLKGGKSGIDLVLFTSWDRFSRNIADAYCMIQKLKNIGISSQAIDQPIDLTIPESKIMLAVYLATSEVENDRRSNNVRIGIHKAKQEGKWTSRAPLGYQNRLSVTGHKYIALHEPEASILRYVFETVAKGEYSVNYIFNQSIMAGLKCSRSNFWSLLKNPVYCGKIIVPEFGTDKKYIVNGLHQQLISTLLFDHVQEILNKKRVKKVSGKVKIVDQLVLRGFLLCPSCSKTLTGSASKGRYERYYYYHCSLGCKFRARADLINHSFLIFLKKLTAVEPYLELSREIVKDLYYGFHNDNNVEQKRIRLNAGKLVDKIVNARDLFTRADIDYDNYLTIETNCKNKLNDYIKELQLLVVSSFSSNNNNYQTSMVLDNISDFYSKSDTLVKRELIYLLFPSKIILNRDGDFEGMLCTPLKIIFNIKTNLKYSDLENIDLRVSQAEEKYLKIISQYRSNDSTISPKIASEIVYLLKKIILFGI
jgi:site-specific DNA recombinase